MELLGVIVFYLVFKDVGMDSLKVLWFLIFYSVFVFCIAGFGLFNDSFESYSSNVVMNMIIFVLVIVGLLGFIVIMDLWYCLWGCLKEFLFIIKIVIFGFVLFFGFGMFLFYYIELSICGMEVVWVKFFF